MRTNATGMRNAIFIVPLTLLVSSCGAADPRINAVESFVVDNEQALARVGESYDLSERDVALLRAAVNDIVERERIAGERLEMAARDYEYATIHNHLAGHEFARAARKYKIAAVEYEQIASLIVRAASSGRVLDTLCKQPTKDVRQLVPQIVGAPNVEQAARSAIPLELPLPVKNALVKRAIRMLLCEK